MVVICNNKQETASEGVPVSSVYIIDVKVILEPQTSHKLKHPGLFLALDFSFWRFFLLWVRFWLKPTVELQIVVWYPNRLAYLSEWLTLLGMCTKQKHSSLHRPSETTGSNFSLSAALLPWFHESVLRSFPGACRGSLAFKGKGTQNRV